MTLVDWGWTERLEELFAEYASDGWEPGRIVRPERGVFRLVSGEGTEYDGRLTGRALGRGEAPAAGDWVAWREVGGTAVIGAVLPRRGVVSRKASGGTAEQQVIAANIDVLFIVQALGESRGFTPRGLERYAAMAWESGCRPVVALNKSDLSDNPAGDLLDAEAVAPGIEILLCSTVTGEGMEELAKSLEPGETGAFIGPSGAGKSSLLNALAGRRMERVGKVRDSDGRGRHTTTHRELHRLEDGRILLDTPGLRELSPWGDASAADAAFPEIEAAAQRCRFRDCGHGNEPGCAVREDLEAELIEPERFDAWMELRRELSWLETRRDERAKRDYEKKWIDIAKLTRNLKKNKESW
jgi:ribosome biogenesis GTPase / thiamine phosphate phosphatase